MLDDSDTSQTNPVCEVIATEPSSTATHQSNEVEASLPNVEVEEKQEEALNSGEVIEFQAFLDKAEWISQKILLLETMPPIEVFAGLEALIDDSENRTGVPTRAQLKAWLAEQDQIEAEAEKFDAKDMSRLKKYAKAAAQKNLSPADTDLIEVTLTTLLSLDKLLHLLRGRSDTLEQLSLRLTWDDQRIAAWKERQSILAGLDTFIRTRARWSPATYDQPPSGSVSLSNSQSSPVALPTGDSKFSRGNRFRLAEMLSHDAAQFASRLTSLKHTLVVPSGKTLDKLIEKRTVPDQFLDAQDRLEDQLKPIESLGKFAMQVVMQWKKADEIYGELKKDQAAAEALQQEIEAARLVHPSARQDASFLSRSKALTSRLSLIGDPGASRTFPRPTHATFPDQPETNSAITRTLSTELSTVTSLARKAAASASEYHVAVKATTQAESIQGQIDQLTSQLESLTTTLLEGVSVQDGDGSPPDLTVVTCLDSTRHSAYLALLPSTITTLEQTDANGTRALAACRTTMLKLDQCANLDPKFNIDVIQSLERFESARTRMRDVKADVTTRVTKLREARKVWASISEATTALDRIREEVADAMEMQKWKAQVGRDGAPLTPESPPGDLPSLNTTYADILTRLDDLGSQIPVNVVNPLVILMQTLDSPLSGHLQSSSDGLAGYLSNIKSLVKMWESIQKQATVMGEIRDEAHELEKSIDILSNRLEGSQQSVWDSSVDVQALIVTESDYAKEIASLQSEIDTFTDSLHARIPFIGRPDQYFCRPLRHRHTSVSSTISRSDSLSFTSHFSLPFDVSVVDHSVRTDANALSLALSSGIHGVSKKLDHLRLARLGRETDELLKPAVQELEHLRNALTCQQDEFGTFDTVSPEDNSLPPLIQRLSQLKVVLESFGHNRTKMSRSMSPVRERLQTLQTSPGAHDAVAHTAIVVPRIRAFEDIETKADILTNDILAFQEVVAQAERVELERLEAERLRLEEEEKRRIAEELRLAAEAEEARRTAEAARLAEEAKLEAEEKARLEAEERRRVEEEARARQEAEELERKRVAEEMARKDAEEKARKDAEERELQAALELAKREAEEVVRRQAEVLARLEDEKRLQLEREEVARLEAEARLQREAEERARWEAELKAREEAVRVAEEAAKLEAEDLARQKAAQAQNATEGASQRRPPSQSSDVFGLRVAPVLSARGTKSEELTELLTHISALRKRLKNLNLRGHVRSSSPSLPTEEFVANLQREYTAIGAALGKIPDSKLGLDSDVDSELNSLKFEIDASKPLLDRLLRISSFARHIVNCDSAFSDLLEHIDSFPSCPPSSSLSSTHVSNLQLSPEEQLKARISFSRQQMDAMKAEARPIIDDRRVADERSRVEQTWKELWDMAIDRLHGSRSRPSTASGLSSGRESSASVESVTRPKARNALSGTLNANKKTFLSPTPRRPSKAATGPANRPASGSLSTPRPASGAIEPHKRPLSNMSNRSTSNISNRSVSGPLSSNPSSLHGSTYASRQRTSSLSNTLPGTPISTPSKRQETSSSRVRTGSRPLVSAGKRPVSPAGSESSSRVFPTQTSRPRGGHKPSSSISKNHNPTEPRPRKAYVPNPKNKLDMAVGQVVNQLPVGVNIEAVTNDWEDQSGKYWIGDSDPKLCFCRILRSHTVMVRVGGGWVELSKFIKDHFADLFRFAPSPLPGGSIGSVEERWISSSTLLETTEPDSPARNLRTPEPKFPSMSPSITLATPSGRSPHSLHSTSPSSGSPLTGLQFMRRAEDLARPVTPSKSPSQRGGTTPVRSTPSRPLVWRF